MGIINDPKQLNLIYSSADIFLCPSISENLPNTILEAMSSGTPTVAFDIGGIGDIITHKKMDIYVRRMIMKSYMKELNG